VGDDEETVVLWSVLYEANGSANQGIIIIIIIIIDIICR
jgi:hypothetical protein